MISNNACYSANSSVEIEDCLDKLQSHETGDVDPSLMTGHEQLLAYADAIGWEKGDYRYFACTYPYYDKKKQKNDTTLKYFKCENRGGGKLWIIPQLPVFRNGKQLEDGTTKVWKDGKGFFGDINVFNYWVEGGIYLSTGIKFNKLEGGCGSKHFVSSSCIAFEHDKLSLEEQEERIAELSELTGFDFSIVFSGSASYHVYISLDKPIYDAELWKYAQELMISAAHSDPAIVNVDRHLRPPLTLRNKKGEIKTCNLVKISKRKYSIEDTINRLEQAFLDIYSINPSQLSRDEWRKLYSDKIRPAINEGLDYDQIRELVNQPIQTPKKRTPLNPELKQAVVKNIKQKRKEKNDNVYSILDVLSKQTKHNLVNPIPDGTGHSTLLSLSICLHQATNACIEYGVPIDPNEAEALYWQAVDSYQGDADKEHAQYLWEEGARYAELTPYPGGEDRLLRRIGYLDNINGFEGNPDNEEATTQSEEEIKAERKKRDDKHWAKLTALGEYKAKNLTYTHTNFDLQSYQEETKKLIKPGAINIVIAKPGLGKSQMARAIALESNNVLVLSPLIALGRNFASEEWRLDYKCEDINYSSGESSRRVQTYKTYTHYSEHLLAQPKAFEFADEFPSGVKQLLGISGGGIYKPWERQAWLTHFKNTLETAAKTGNTVIIASNDFLDIHIEFIHKTISEDIEINVIINDYIPERPKVKFYTDEKPEGFLIKLEQTVARNWNAETNSFNGGVLFFSDYKGGKRGSSINAKSIEQNHPEWAGFILDANGDTKKDEKVQAYFANSNEEIKKYGLASHSNVVINGISITNGWADSVYCLMNGLDSPEDVHQKILRERTAKDINVWVAERNTSQVGCPYTDWEHVRSFYTKRYKQNAIAQKEALDGLGIKFDVTTMDYSSSPAIDLFCKLVAIENLKNRYLREYTKQHLEKSGYIVEEVQTEFTKPEEENKKRQNEVVVFEENYNEVTAIDEAEDLIPEAVEACKEDPAYRYAVMKFFLKKKYPPEFIEGYRGLEVANPRTNEVIKLEGLAGIAWLDKSQNLASKFSKGYTVLCTKELTPILEDLEKAMNMLIDFRSNGVQRKLMPQDFSASTLEIKTLRELNLSELIEKLEVGTSLEENSKAVDDFCSKVRTLNTKLALNITVNKNTRNKDILDKILEDKLGLPVTRERKRQGKARPYLYYINPDHLAWFHLFCDCLKLQRKTEYRPEYLAEQVQILLG